MPRRPHSPPPESRRWHVPPPLVRGGAALEGASILQEITGEFGILLWQSLRTVTLWAAAEPSQRAELFLPGAEERRAAMLSSVGTEPELREPLGTITGLLGLRSEADPAAVGAACTQVAAWALGKGAKATAFEFTQAAALASPSDPKLALAVARAARNGSEYSGSEAWYQRTVGLARQAGDWDTYARAYIGLGKMAAARGAYPAARKNFLKARRAAERKGINEVLGMALHDLFTVEGESQRPSKALKYAAAAVRAYGPGHPTLPTLAHDVAYTLIIQGHFAPALQVLQAAVPRMLPYQQLWGQGNLARAAGIVGDTQTFASAWDAVLAAEDDHPAKPDASLGAARGAASLGRWSDAEHAARTALEIARRRQRNKVILEAESVLNRIEMERVADTAGTIPKVAAVPREQVDALARQFTQSLEVSTAANQSPTTR